MAKSSRTRTTRSCRFTPFSRNAIAPPRPRDLARPLPSRYPVTPEDFLIRGLLQNHAEGPYDLSLAGPGAHVEVTMRVFVEVTQGEIEGIFKDPSTFTLVIRVETGLPTGGLHTARVAAWSGCDWDALDGPLWLSDVRAGPAHPLKFTRSLGWLWATISAINARASRRDGDVWWRFLRFLNCVKEAYRTPPLPSPGHILRPRPRPRPRRSKEALDNLAERLGTMSLVENPENVSLVVDRLRLMSL
ncbi:hypothetical protein C8Q76DRAFT_297285 [Earliella scabrosa]|nr:hypothetical protein C8Q76DRAFT_297285 [Earliella scabrosa]